MFSPYYARARRRGVADPLNHCAVNAALYGRGGKRWAFTERGAASVLRDADSLSIGPSSLAWDGKALTVRIDEWTAPRPSRIRGHVRLEPDALFERAFPLDGAARHRWHPLAPCARVDVALERPALRWSGRGYLDSNRGDEPLEAAFSRWHWSRSPLRGGATAVLYDVARRSGDELSLALRFAAGELREVEPPPLVALPGTRWRVARVTRADPGGPAVAVETLEDTPFYARGLVSAGVLGEQVTSFHESLSLDRFARRWVQALLPFRMRRSRA